MFIKLPGIQLKFKLKKVLKTLTIFLLVTSWLITGWPGFYITPQLRFPPKIKEAHAAVAYDIASESHTGTTGSTSEASFSWSHNPTGTPRGVLVFVWSAASSGFATSVTYDGTNVPAVSGGIASDIAGEVGTVQTYFLGTGVPVTNPATVLVNRTNNATEMWASAITLTALTDTEVYTPGIVILQGDGTYTVQSVTDGSPGTDSVRFAGGHSGGASLLSPGAGSSAVNDFDTGNFTMTVVRETTAGQGARNVGFSYATTDDRAAVHLAVREMPPSTTLGADTGNDPATVTVAPGSVIRDGGAFTFQTSTGTDTITQLNINLASLGTPYNGVSEVRITDSTGSTTYWGAVSNPTSNSLTFCSASCSGNGATNIIATTTPTTYKIRITPKTHANMAVPGGASYDLSPTVSDWTGTNTKLGSDTNANTLTIDNLSPNGATSVSGTAGNAAVTLNWTTSNSGDFNTTNGSVVLRWASGTAGSEVPVEGNSSYAAGNTITTATVACVISSAGSSAQSKIDGTGGSAGCTTTALTNGQAYTYKVFQRDTNGNYDTGVSIGTFTPTAAVATFTQNKYLWYVDNDLVDPTAIWGNPDLTENQSIVVIPAGNDPPGVGQELRLRVNYVVNTAGISISEKYFKLEYKAGTDGSCTTGSWTDVGTGDWVYATSTVTDGADITKVLSDTTVGKGEEYVKGKPSQVNHVAASAAEIIEYDFHIVGTNSTANTQYSFRVVETNSGGTSETVFDGYTNCPTLTTEPGTSNLLRHGNVFTEGLEKGFFWAD